MNKEVVLKDFFQQINKKIKESNLENIYYYNENGELIHALAEKHMEELYNELKNQDDGFIYIYYTDKNLLWMVNYKYNKEMFNLEQRKQQLADLNLNKNQLCLIIQPLIESEICKQFTEKEQKLIVSQQTPVQEILDTIYKNFWQQFKPEQFFVFINEKILLTNQFSTIGEVYTKHSDQDGFLYLFVAEFNPYKMTYKQSHTL